MIYQPREDSFMLKEHVENLQLEGRKFLEVGTGSGIIAETALKQGAKVTATDINPEALQGLSKEIDVYESNLFEEIDEKYDFIVFNPPYLPEDSENYEGHETWDGGDKGIETTEKFLSQCKNYLKESGKAFVILSSLSNYGKLVQKYDLEQVDSRKLFFEEIMLMKYNLE